MHFSYHNFHLLLHIFNNCQSEMELADRLQYITNMFMIIYVPSFLPQMYTSENPRVLQPHPNICNHLWTKTACHLSLGFSMHTTTDVILVLCIFKRNKYVSRQTTSQNMPRLSVQRASLTQQLVLCFI